MHSISTPLRYALLLAGLLYGGLNPTTAHGHFVYAAAPGESTGLPAKTEWLAADFISVPPSSFITLTRVGVMMEGNGQTNVQIILFRASDSVNRNVDSGIVDFITLTKEQTALYDAFQQTQREIRLLGPQTRALTDGTVTLTVEHRFDVVTKALNGKTYQEFDIPYVLPEGDWTIAAFWSGSTPVTVFSDFKEDGQVPPFTGMITGLPVPFPVPIPNIVDVRYAQHSALDMWIEFTDGTEPTPSPTMSPTGTPSPTASPTMSPTINPTVSPSPTRSPTMTVSPTPSPTAMATVSPSPTMSPTSSPTPATPTPTPILGQTPTPSPTPVITPEPGTSIIAGRVWNDVNRNGQQGNNEPRIHFAEVRLLNGSNEVVDIQYTTNIGTFLFNGIPIGDYIIEVPTPPLAGDWSVTVQNAGSNDDTDSDIREVDNKTTLIRITANNTVVGSVGAGFFNSMELTPSPSPTLTSSPTATRSPTASPTRSPSPTVSPTTSPSPSASPTRSPSPSPTISPSPTPSPTIAPTVSPSPTVGPTATPRDVENILCQTFIDDNENGWFGLVTVGDGSVFAQDGLCMTVPFPGNNIAGWYQADENAYVDLVDGSVYRLKVEMTTDQADAEALPVWNMSYGNWFADRLAGNNYGGQQWVLGAGGGAQAIGSPPGRSKFEMWIAPNAFQTAQWRETMFNPDTDDNDFLVAVRVLDLASGDHASENDSGTICMRSMCVDRVNYNVMRNGAELVYNPRITNDNYAIKDDDHNGTSQIDDLSGEALLQLVPPQIGTEIDRATLIPWNDALVDEHWRLALNPILWEADALYASEARIRSNVDLDGFGPGRGNTEGRNPVHVISMQFIVANAELGKVDLTTRGSNNNFFGAASPRLPMNSPDGRAQIYTGLFYTHNVTVVDPTVEPHANYWRPEIDFMNSVNLAQPDGTDPIAIESFEVWKLTNPLPNN